MSNPLAALAPGALASMPPEDPGPAFSLCFDYVNNGSCPRLKAGEKCKYRHLPPLHPDVIADKIKQVGGWGRWRAGTGKRVEGNLWNYREEFG